MVDGGALDVHVAPLRVRSDEPVEVAAFELVCFRGQRLQVGDTEMIGARGERGVVAGQRGQRGVAARGRAANREPSRVDPAPRSQTAYTNRLVERVETHPSLRHRTNHITALVGTLASHATHSHLLPIMKRWLTAPRPRVRK